MKKLSIFLTIALAAVIYSCGNGGKGSNEQKADSLATETVEQTDKEPQITLTVKSGELIKLGFSADAENTQVKIISGKRDTSFMIGTDFTKIKYLSDDNTMTIYGNITTFNCSFNDNSITALDLSKNSSLINLNCSWLSITELDLSKNTSLKHLDCDKTLITKLDFSKNTDLDTLACRYTNLTALDVSKNTKLIYLDCNGSKLSHIDLSNNTSLAYLDITGNQLSSLDISKNTKLEYICCNNNKLGDIDISKNTALMNLYCTNIGLTSLELSKNPNIVELYISWNPIKENPENSELLFNSLPDRKGKKQGLIMCEDIEEYANPDKLFKIAQKKNWIIDVDDFDGDPESEGY